jgi:Haloacid dehalogenase-like hydrolase
MARADIRSWLIDMDGVLVREERAIAGADRFLQALAAAGLAFLVLANNSIYTRRDLSARLRLAGLEVPESAIWTSALATADFLADQRPGGSAFVIGEAGLTTALHQVGYTLTEREPDYVVLGETRTYSFERITRAIRLIVAGARFIATNPDTTGPTADGHAPGDGLGRRAHQPGDRRRAVLRRQADSLILLPVISSAVGWSTGTGSSSPESSSTATLVHASLRTTGSIHPSEPSAWTMKRSTSLARAARTAARSGAAPSTRPRWRTGSLRAARGCHSPRPAGDPSYW